MTKENFWINETIAAFWDTGAAYNGVKGEA